MIVCGIDGALSTTGIAIMNMDNKDMIEVNKISTKYDKSIKNETEDKRILYICDNIINYCKKHNVDTVIMEDQYISAVTSKQTAMTLCRLRGAIMYALYNNNIDVEYVSTSTMTSSVVALSGVSFPKGFDKKLKCYTALKAIYKDNELFNSIGAFSDKQNKSKTSDMYDAIGLITYYANIK